MRECDARRGQRYGWSTPRAAIKLSAMLARTCSALMTLLALVSAYLQLNDPDPERWFAIYFACAVVALLGALGRPSRGLSLGVGGVAFLWALAILPELLGGWNPGQLTATMSAEHPEVEFGRECAGLLIVSGYCLFAFAWARRLHGEPAEAPTRVPHAS
jgi:hypothetical protein